MLNSRSASFVGFAAVVLWATLAALTALSGPVPPFELLALTFTIGATMGALSWLFRPQAAKALRQPWPVWLLGVGGLFGYHAVYFAALKSAPPAEASLIAYLWPLFLVVFSALLPGERLQWHHLAGAALGFSGLAVLAIGRGVDFDPTYALGYGLAFGCALIWSTYSVASRRFKAVPTDAVVGFCGATAVLGLACHLAWETTVWPSGWNWVAIAGLGLGPVGAAFYAWDYGVKHGDIRMLGVSSYASPILSTLIMVFLNLAVPTAALAGACLLIAGGALVAAKDVVFKRSQG